MYFWSSLPTFTFLTKNLRTFIVIRATFPASTCREKLNEEQRFLLNFCYVQGRIDKETERRKW
jgi:hypothetical protein